MAKKTTPKKAAPKKAAPKKAVPKGTVMGTMKPVDQSQADHVAELAAELVEKYGDLLLSDVLHEEVRDVTYHLANKAADDLKTRGIEAQVRVLVEGGGYSFERIREIVHDELGNEGEKPEGEKPEGEKPEGEKPDGEAVQDPTQG